MINNRMKRRRFISAILILVCLAIVCMSGCGKQEKPQESGEKTYEVEKENAPIEDVEMPDSEALEETAKQNDRLENVLEMHLLDADQGSSILIKDGKHSLLYDGGDSGTSSYVVAYLKKQGIEKLDYIIASHYDADHISGLIGVLNVFECEKVICPDYETDTDIFFSFESMLAKNGAEVVFPKCGETFLFGDATFTIVGPQSYSYATENDRSICVRLEYGRTHFLMCGDAEYPAENDMINSFEEIQSDVLVVSHHGSGNASSKEFLDAVEPQYALISCMLGNQYGHPAEETLSRLKELGCELYRTDLQNEVIAYSDGAEIWFNQEPTSDWRSGVELLNQMDSQNSNDMGNQAKDTTVTNNNEPIQYVCNTNTMRFHYDYCNSVRQMSEKNKKYTTVTRDELIAHGYKSCGNCNP